jgi:hypothetical protein
MSSTSFWLVCDSPNENCHCDWRVELEGCREREIMHYIYLANTIWTAIVLLLGNENTMFSFLKKK